VVRGTCVTNARHKHVPVSRTSRTGPGISRISWSRFLEKGVYCFCITNGPNSSKIVLDRREAKTALDCPKLSVSSHILPRAPLRYSRFPKNPALLLLKKSFKSVSTTSRIGLHTAPLFPGRQGRATDKTPYNRPITVGSQNALTTPQVAPSTFTIWVKWHPYRAFICHFCVKTGRLSPTKVHSRHLLNHVHPPEKLFFATPC